MWGNFYTEQPDYFLKQVRGPLAVKHELKRLWGTHSVNTQRDWVTKTQATQDCATGLLPDTVSVSLRDVSKHKGKVVGSRAWSVQQTPNVYACAKRTSTSYVIDLSAAVNLVKMRMNLLSSPSSFRFSTEEIASVLSTEKIASGSLILPRFSRQINILQVLLL